MAKKPYKRDILSDFKPSNNQLTRFLNIFNFFKILCAVTMIYKKQKNIRLNIANNMQNANDKNKMKSLK